jgi:PEP-CTERM motif
MKRILFVGLLALALPLAAFANSVDFNGIGGTLSGLSDGLTLSGTGLIGVSGLYGLGTVAGTGLGSISLSTGALLSSVYTGGVLTSATFNGGSFTITGNGIDGIPSGVIFTGTFTGNVTMSGGTTGYVLSGGFSGTLSGGGTLSGVLGITTDSTGKKGYTGRVGVGSVDITGGSAVPEPSTLGLMGSGLLGLGALVRRKIRA